MAGRQAQVLVEQERAWPARSEISPRLVRGRQRVVHRQRAGPRGQAEHGVGLAAHQVRDRRHHEPGSLRGVVQHHDLHQGPSTSWPATRTRCTSSRSSSTTTSAGPPGRSDLEARRSVAQQLCRARGRGGQRVDLRRRRSAPPRGRSRPGSRRCRPGRRRGRGRRRRAPRRPAPPAGSARHRTRPRPWRPSRAPTDRVRPPAPGAPTRRRGGRRRRSAARRRRPSSVRRRPARARVPTPPASRCRGASPCGPRRRRPRAPARPSRSCAPPPRASRGRRPIGSPPPPRAARGRW